MVIDFHRDDRETADGNGDTAPLLLRAVEVARLLGLSRSNVYALMSTGTLPVVRIGRAIRVPRPALLEWIEKNTRRAA